MGSHKGKITHPNGFLHVGKQLLLATSDRQGTIDFATGSTPNNPILH
jgi:hypothetical protein